MDLVNGATLVIAVLSFVGSAFAVHTARNANTIAASSTWAADVYGELKAELLNAAEDENLVMAFCNVPFENLDAKRSHRDSLNQLRDESQRRVALLSELVNTGKLQATKAARDRIDDSYWDNEALALVPDRGRGKFVEYLDKADEHRCEIRTLMSGISSNRMKMLAAPASGSSRRQLGDGR